MTQTTRYAAVLAKIGTERGTLLTEANLIALTESKSLEDFTNLLRETTYSEKLTEVAPPINSRKLEHALKERLIETYTKIVKYSPKNVRTFLEAQLLGFEVENIKTLIKGITAKLATEERIARVHLSAEEPLKRRAVFEQASQATDLRALIDALKRTGYTMALTMGLKRNEETGSTQSFDILLDREYHEQMWTVFQKLPDGEKKRAFFYASLENDGFTLFTILRGKILGYDPNWLRLSIPSNNFNIQKKAIEDMISASDFDSALSIAQKTYRGLFVNAQTPEETVANAQKVFKKELFNHAYSNIIRESFSIEAPLALLVQKEIETQNLEAIALGLEIAQKPENIQSTLLLHG